jgi:hypothetical protein
MMTDFRPRAIVPASFARSTVYAFLVLGPGIARADDCAAIYAAFEALAKAPSYTQTITMADMSAMKAIVIGETVYAHDGSEWTKISLKSGGRADILAQFVPNAGSLKDCRSAGADEVEGKAMTTYSYVPPVPEGMEKFAPKDPKQQVWIGDADGLPYRMTAEGMVVAISFEPVAPPM